MEGYRNNIIVILDLKDPAKPQEVGRWWMPGQWEAGGEARTFKNDGPREPRAHHALRRGDRLYVSYWHGGGFIVDISDMSKPRTVSHLDYGTAFPWPTHSLLPVPFEIWGHKWMLVADEDVLPKETDKQPQMPAFLWMVNITDEKKPVPVSSYQVEGVNGKGFGPNTGCHQPVEEIISNEVPCAWFAQGLRIIDISNPQRMSEAAYYLPDPAPGPLAHRQLQRVGHALAGQGQSLGGGLIMASARSPAPPRRSGGGHRARARTRWVHAHWNAAPAHP